MRFHAKFHGERVIRCWITAI